MLYEPSRVAGFIAILTILRLNLSKSYMPLKVLKELSKAIRIGRYKLSLRHSSTKHSIYV